MHTKVKPSASMKVHYAWPANLFINPFVDCKFKECINMWQLQCRLKVKFQFHMAYYGHLPHFLFSQADTVPVFRRFAKQFMQFVANFNSCNFFLMWNFSVCKACISCHETAFFGDANFISHVTQIIQHAFSQTKENICDFQKWFILQRQKCGYNSEKFWKISCYGDWILV